MCRRADYRRKKHYACFRCRKAFKQRGSSDPQAEGAHRHFPCPECGGLMRDMGADFKAPVQRNARQWQKVEVLASYGIVYHPGCCDGPGERPAELSEVEEFLVAQGRSRREVRKRIAAVKRLRGGAKAGA